MFFVLYEYLLFVVFSSQGRQENLTRNNHLPFVAGDPCRAYSPAPAGSPASAASPPPAPALPGDGRPSPSPEGPTIVKCPHCLVKLNLLA